MSVTVMSGILAWLPVRNQWIWRRAGPRRASGCARAARNRSESPFANRSAGGPPGLHGVERSRERDAGAVRVAVGRRPGFEVAALLEHFDKRIEPIACAEIQVLRHPIGDANLNVGAEHPGKQPIVARRERIRDWKEGRKDRRRYREQGRRTGRRLLPAE